MSSMFKGIVGGDEFLTEVLTRGLTLHGPADAYYISHCSDQLSSRLQAKCGVHAIKNIVDLVPKCAVLFLAIQPEEAPALLPKIADKIKEWTLVVSVVRDLKLATLEYFFPNNEIIRLSISPSVISGMGLSAYAVSRNASTDAKSMAEIVLKQCGDVIAVENEEELEKITDYLAANTYLTYVVIQAMIKNARKVGMASKEANSAVDKLLKGSMHTLIDLGYDTADVISRGMSNKALHDKAIEVIKSYGLDSDLMDKLSGNEEEKPSDEDDPKNYRMHYSWSR